MDSLKNSKFQEELQNHQFWISKDANLLDEDYLVNLQNILVHTVPLVSVLNKEYVYEKQLKVNSVFKKVLFMPSSCYNSQEFCISINSNKINLLNCMYLINQCVQNESIIVSLQNFSGDRQIHASYTIPYKDDDLYSKRIEISAGIIGGKYIIVQFQQENKIVINILKLDLTLEFQFSYSIPKKIIPYISYSFVDCGIDYYEDNIIYILNSQICFRIDLKSRQVIERKFEEEYQHLLRLLPITNSEFNHYFKSSNKESLVGYNNSNENKVILFAILDDSIYQLNIFNLQIIRKTRFNHLYKKPDNYIKDCQIWAVPLHLKNRQRKQFSQWSFLIQNHKGYNLIDWREKDLFCQEKTGVQSEYEVDEKKDISSSQRIIWNKDTIYAISYNRNIHYGQRKDQIYFKKLKVTKMKGDKINIYNKQTLPFNRYNSYFSQNFFIKCFLPPIIYKNEITFPCLMEDISNSNNSIKNFIGFHSFQKQAKNQSRYIAVEVTQNRCQIFQNNNLTQYSFQNGSNIHLCKFTNNTMSIQQFLLPEEFKESIIAEYQFDQTNNEQIFIALKVKTCSLYSCQLIEEENRNPEKLIEPTVLLTQIICFSQFVNDTNNSQKYVPIIYKNENHETCFAIFDLNKKLIIEETIHFTPYTQSLLCNYDQNSKQFTIILLKQVLQNVYIFFYSLNMITFKFKFINFHKFQEKFELGLRSQYLFAKDNIYNIYIPSLNKVIKYDSNQKFEIRSDSNNYLTNYQYEHNYTQKTYDTQKYFDYSTNTKEQIVYLGNYEGYGYSQKLIINIYDIKSKSVQFVDFNMLEEGMPSSTYQLRQLANGEILIYFYHKDDQKVFKIYALQQQF